MLQASQILAYISLFAPQVLILDEPDSHLHPDNQRLLCDLVFRMASERGFQAIISTHSRHVLNSVKGRGSIIWMNKGNKVEAPDINTTEVLLELGALDSVDYFADGETRCVVATEDANKGAIRTLLISNGFVVDDLDVASYTGCSKIESALVLGAFLTDKAPNIHLVVHRDRDYMGDDAANSFEQRLETADLHSLLTESNDIECYFINAAHLNAANPAVPVARIQELIDQATAEMADKSVEALVNLRTAEAFRTRQAGGPQPNHGAIAVQAQADYVANPAAYRRGKIVLGRLTALLQQELGTNPWIYIPSEHLRTNKLAAIAAEIWPPEA